MGKKKGRSTQSPPAKPPEEPLSRSAVKWFLAGGGLVAVATLVYNIVIGQPTIEFTKLSMDSALAPDRPIVLRGTLKNFGPTIARDYGIQMQFAKGPSNQRLPKPDFNMTVDSYGQRSQPSIHDLGPGQEDHFVPTGKYLVIDPIVYREIMQGKSKLLFYAQVTYRDALGLPHEKIICHKIAPNILDALVRCTSED